jgi:hypothetical protein
MASWQHRKTVILYSILSAIKPLTVTLRRIVDLLRVERCSARQDHLTLLQNQPRMLPQRVELDVGMPLLRQAQVIR